jgi:hypothetical protein
MQSDRRIYMQIVISSLKDKDTGSNNSGENVAFIKFTKWQLGDIRANGHRQRENNL